MIKGVSHRIRLSHYVKVTVQPECCQIREGMRKKRREAVAVLPLIRQSFLIFVKQIMFGETKRMLSPTKPRKQRCTGAQRLRRKGWTVTY